MQLGTDIRLEPAEVGTPDRKCRGGGCQPEAEQDQHDESDAAKRDRHS